MPNLNDDYTIKVNVVSFFHDMGNKKGFPFSSFLKLSRFTNIEYNFDTSTSNFVLDR